MSESDSAGAGHAIGMIGLGRMGANMARRLARAGVAQRAAPVGLHVAFGDALHCALHCVAIGHGDDLGKQFPRPGRIGDNRLNHALHQGHGEAIGDGGDQANP